MGVEKIKIETRKKFSPFEYLNRGNDFSYVINPEKNHPVVGVCIAIHGDEWVGIHAVNHFLDRLFCTNFNIRGQLRIIMGNPVGVEKKLRKINHDLNRCFQEGENPIPMETYEGEQVSRIKKFLSPCTHFLDIHSASSPSIPFLIYPHKSIPPALLPLRDIAVHTYNWENFLKGGSLVHWGHQNEKEAFAVECGQHEREECRNTGQRVLYDFLALCGVVPERQKFLKGGKRNLIKVEEFFEAPLQNTQSIQFKVPTQNFQPIKEGQILLEGGGVQIASPFDGYLILPIRHITPGSSLCYVGRAVSPPPFLKEFSPPLKAKPGIETNPMEPID